MFIKNHVAHWQSVISEKLFGLIVSCSIPKLSDMTENENRESSQSPIEDLQKEIESLKERVAQLEATLRNEHDDLLRLKEETRADHRKLEGLSDKAASGGGTSSSSVTPVGL